MELTSLARVLVVERRSLRLLLLLLMLVEEVLEEGVGRSEEGEDEQE